MKLIAALEPNITEVAPVKVVPVMVTSVPPTTFPDAGDTAVTVGAGGVVIPARGTCCRVPVTLRELPVILRSPLLAAYDAGVNVAPTLQAAAAASGVVVLHVVVVESSVKGEDAARPERVIDALPSFSKPVACAADVTPKATGPKLNTGVVVRV